MDQPRDGTGLPRGAVLRGVVAGGIASGIVPTPAIGAKPAPSGLISHAQPVLSPEAGLDGGNAEEQKGQSDEHHDPGGHDEPVSAQPVMGFL
jgi:hypothetical protein